MPRPAAKTIRTLLVLLAAAIPAFAHHHLTQNPHPGLSRLTPPLHQPSTLANSFHAPAFPICVCDPRLRSLSTGKERDAETGLDYFGARYFSGAQGRFTSPDEPLIYQRPSNPQSWNLYSYAYNNPLRFVDPDGHEPCENGYNPENGNICTIAIAPKEKPKPAVPLDSALFFALARGVQRAEPGVNLAGAGLMTFFAVVAPVPALMTDCIAGGPGCDKTNIALAFIPGLAKIRLGATVARAGRGVHAAEILDKTGGFAQATDDFRALEGGAERIIGKVKVKDFPGGDKAILRDFSRDTRPTLEIQHATGETTKFRYNP